MKLKYKLLTLAFGLTLGLIQVAVITPPVSASIPKECQKYADKTDADSLKNYANTNCDESKGGVCHVDYGSTGAVIRCVDPAIDEASEAASTSYNKDDCKADSFDKLSGKNCGILRYIFLITNVLSGIAATVIVAMMIVGGIQYSAAGADPSKIQAAKQKITNALVALVLFVFGFALIQWLVPGGLF